MIGLLLLLAIGAVAVWMLFPSLFVVKKKSVRSVEVGEALPGEGISCHHHITSFTCVHV
jgi:hypothetical protein